MTNKPKRYEKPIKYILDFWIEPEFRKDVYGVKTC